MTTMPQATAGALTPFPEIAGSASSLLSFCQFVLASTAALVVGMTFDGTQRPMATTIAACVAAHVHRLSRAGPAALAAAAGRRLSARSLSRARDDQLLELGNDRRGGVHADALDQRLGEIRQEVVQVAQVFGALQPHHHQIAAKAEVRIDQASESCCWAAMKRSTSSSLRRSGRVAAFTVEGAPNASAQ